MLKIEDDAERFDLRDEAPDDTRPDVEETLEHLRETLTHDLLVRAYVSAHGESPTVDEAEAYREVLVGEAYNAGISDWNEPGVDEFLDWD
ncbi:hypothetical protein [Alienimonas californiensis]|uniref:Uncharacterized protein n=1 Tax=Alienimonas californiensis TaxID=2527989 RepID=A0A517PDK1_9PLAN|nr:hypothetical protein [Alienimonas californiensis]QDT17475.1 hypothetical protein CA12_36000 [Alienimonas californiensis]